MSVESYLLTLLNQRQTLAAALADDLRKPLAVDAKSGFSIPGRVCRLLHQLDNDPRREDAWQSALVEARDCNVLDELLPALRGMRAAHCDLLEAYSAAWEDRCPVDSHQTLVFFGAFSRLRSLLPLVST